MHNAKIEMEFINREWVVQIEASSYMSARRCTLKFATAAEAFAGALDQYQKFVALVEPKVEPEPAPDPIPEPLRSEIVSRFAAVAEDEAELKKQEAIDDQFRDGAQWTPEQIAAMKAQQENPPNYEGKIGRHPNACVCTRCTAKRAA